MPKIKVDVVADTSQLGKGLRDGSADLKKFGSTATSVFKGGLGVSAVTGAVSAAAEGVRKFGGLLKDSVGEARDSQKVGALTVSTIKATGGAANISANQIGALSTALSNKTGIDDEAVQSGANLLLTFKGVQNQVGKGNDIFNQATSTVLDMSKALGQDGKSSAIQLGKALNDPVKGITALSRVGVSFTDQQKKQIAASVKAGDTLGAQKIILKELQSEFGGAAVASATAGEKATTYANNLKEAFGTNLLPVIDGFANLFVSTLGPAIGKGIAATGPYLAKLGGLVKSSGPAVTSAIDGIKSAFATIAPIVSGVVGAIGPVFSQIAAVVGPALSGIASQVGPVFAQIGTAVGPILAALGPALATAFGVLGPVLAQLAAAFATLAPQLSPLSILLAAIAPIAPVIAAAFVQLATAVGGVLATALAAILPVLVQLAGVVATTIVPFLSTLISTLLPPLVGIVSALLPVIGAIIAAVAPIIGMLVSQLAPILTLIAQQLFPALAAVLGVIGPLFTALIPIITGVIGVVGKVISALLPVITAVFGAVVSIIRSALRIVQGIIQVVTGIISGNWGQVWAGMKNIIAGVWGVIKAVIVGALSIIKAAIVAAWNIVKAVTSAAWKAFKSLITSALTAAKAAISAKLTEIVGVVKGLPGKIKGALGNLGSLLVGSGKALLAGFAQGITKGIGAAVGAAKNAVQAIKDFFPHSPAKRGPFSGSGWTLYSGRSIGAALAQGMSDSERSVVRGADRLAEAAMVRTAVLGARVLPAPSVAATAAATGVAAAAQPGPVLSDADIDRLAAAFAGQLKALDPRGMGAFVAAGQKFNGSRGGRK